MTEYRVDELARAAGTSVRNVRVYQDRGLLPPPRREGRVGWYSEDHLERLQLISRLLERGYTFATISELLEVYSTGGGLGQVLGLREAIGGPWSQEQPGQVTRAQLLEWFGEQAPEFISHGVGLGILEPTVPESTGDVEYVTPSPGLLEAGRDMIAAGVPLESVMRIADTVHRHLTEVAELFFTVVADTLTPGSRPLDEQAGPLPGAAPHNLDAVVEIVTHLRPHAMRTVESIFALAMHQQAERVLENIARRTLTGEPIDHPCDPTADPTVVATTTAPSSVTVSGDTRGD